MKKEIMASVLAATMVFGSVTAFASDSKSTVVPISAAAAETPIVGVPQITVDGEKVDLDKLNISQYMYTENENTLVPLRAVAEKMGYTVAWDNTAKAVTVSDDEWEVVLEIGVDSYYGVTKIKDAVGMTAPQSYGVAPKIIESTTFVPAKMFELMGYEFSAVGQYGSFSKAGTDDNGNAQIPNPFTEYKTADDAKKALSFDAKLPSYIPNGYKLSYVSVMGGNFLNLDYTNGGKEITYRTADSEDDISGVYIDYKTVAKEKVGNAEVTLKGTDGKYFVATWNDGFAYSVYAENGVDKAEMIKIIKNVK